MDRRSFVRTSAGLGLSAPVAASAAEGGASINAVKGVILDWQRKDIDAVLARVTDDIVWYSHVGTPPTRGKQAMRGKLVSLAEGTSESRWRIFSYAVSGQQIFMEGAEDFVITAEKRRVALPYMGVMTFRGALIAEWRDYFDRGLFDRLKAGEPTPPEIASLLDRPGIP